MELSWQDMNTPVTVMPDGSIMLASDRQRLIAARVKKQERLRDRQHLIAAIQAECENFGAA